MKLHVDDYFQIGSAHIAQGKPAQDYVRSEIKNGVAYAALSDGCSSGDETDVGARMIALNMLRTLKDNPELVERVDDENSENLQALVSEMLAGLGVSKRLFDLTDKDLLGTLLSAFVGPNGAFVHVLGDGVVAFKYKSGHIDLWRLEWNRNTPYYPIYGKYHKGFRNFHEKTSKGDPFTIECMSSDTSNLSDFCEHTTSCGIEDGERGFLMTPKVVHGDLEFVALFSDGVTQIDSVDWKDAVLECLKFKNTTGAFVKRRAIRFLRDAAKQGKGAIDDFSIAVIHIVEEKEHGTES